ncbi:23S rRNA (pseudouridine(1915)-N(3))-methyltransferase RlmH [Methanoplanus endosymbiosus]|uniref:Putative ribosomal RNA large subunit methyltransferase H n=1 Tax=Methanoplanus endosymbiosus TaxID=33865 RepID=A0A9E7TKG3_9EURY|nr:23S rRNA (pseudouridine(1915)-N(3))-methyltransferase RlmH [Methanoplanus endosymbiosus]UUX92699.1 23S rRNA (pseudouridine(1915)-N(3))-methyltransferase RlmH [Methanoplanus endosymbiosus]
MPAQIRIIAIGKIKERYISDGIDEYLKRLRPYAGTEIIQVADESIPEKASAAIIKSILDKEGDKVLKQTGSDDFVILLDLHGKEYSSEGIAEIISEQELSCRGRMVFCIGGSLGVSDLLIRRADIRWKLSDLTFPHQFVRLLTVEQIYRAFKISRKEKYHR